MFAADEDHAERGKLSASKRELIIEIPFEVQKENVVPTGINKNKEIDMEYEEEMQILSGITIVSQESESQIEVFSSGSLTQISEDTAAKPNSEDSTNPSLVDGVYEKLVNKSYENFPHGTPRLAALQSTSNSLAIWRRFSRSHCRLLQRLQNQITKLEQQLDILDEKDARSDKEYRLMRNDWHENWDRTQEDLLDELKAKLSEYDDLLIKDSQLRRLAPTPPHDHLHLFNWILGTKPLDEGHYDFIFHHNDFVSLSNVARTTNSFDNLIESFLSRWPGSPFQHFMSTNESSTDPQVYFFSRSKITLIARLTTLCIAVTILMIPIFLFSLLNLSQRMMLVIVVVFMLLFAMIVSLFAGASMENMFLGTCAYAAVLVTFLGNVQPK